MPQINYDSDSSARNALLRIAESTGLNNFSKTSKTKLISETVVNEVDTFIGVMLDVRDNLYPESAEGRYLDLIGSQNKVYRNAKTSLPIKDSDMILKLRARDPDYTLGQILNKPTTIFQGEEVSISSNVSLTFTSPVFVYPDSEYVFISAKIEPKSSASFSLNKGDMLKLSNDLIEVGTLGSGLSIEVMEDISFSTSDLEDSEFRKTVILARDGGSIAVASAINAAILQTPTVAGYAYYPETRGSGTADIYIVTEKMMQGDVDSAVDSIARSLDFKLRSVVAEGVSYKVMTPRRLEASIFYTTGSSQVSESVISGAIHSSIMSIYRFSESSSIDLNRVEAKVVDLLPELESLSIHSINLYDAEIGEFISFSQSTVVPPKGTYVTFDRNSVSVFE